MEPHPVPKNVLTVEFKLFGSLTVKQFVKILLGAVVALGVFALQLPFLIAAPIIVISIGLGILSAMADGFDEKLVGFLKSVFISPRYVWRKKEADLDVLRAEEKKATGSKSIQKIEKSQSSEEIIEDISIERLLDAKAASRIEEPQDVGYKQTSGFERVYAEEFESSIGSATQTQPITTPPTTMAGQRQNGKSVSLGPNSQAIIRDSVSQITNPAEVSNQTVQESPSVQNQIDQVFAEEMDKVVETLPAVETLAPKSARLLAGVVVNKQDQPVANAQVMISDTAGNQIGSGASGVDGRFAIEAEIPAGNYIIRLLSDSVNFPEFRFSIPDGELPAYKFRGL